MFWVQAYFLLACCFFQTFLTCALGTVVEIAVSQSKNYKILGFKLSIGDEKP